jgi:hypothetical protein
MAYTVPQDVLNYFNGYSASPFGAWWNDPSKTGRYTDSQGYQWMPNWEDGSGIGVDPSNYQGNLLGYRRGEIAGELNDPFRREATNLYFDPQGQFQYANKDDPGWLNPITGILAVASLGLGAGALAAGGEAAAGVGAAEAGMGAGAATGADMAAFYGGLDGAATLGGGATVNGGAALGAAGAGGAGAAGAGGYLGDATAAGYGGLDSASASTMGGGASVNGGSALGGSSAMGAGAGGGTSPPANPYASGGSDWSSMLSNGVQNMEMGDWAKLASAALGAYGGSQGTQNSQTTQNKMDPRLDPYLYGDLFPRAQGLLNTQFGQAQTQSGAMNQVGMGLLGTNPNPDMASNPYISGVANDIQRRTGDLLGQGFNSIRGNQIMTGGLGGTRQGVAEGEAMKGAADSLQGQLSNLYYGAYNQDANRNLQKIGMGAGLLGQSQQQAYSPLNQASELYRPYTGLNSSMTTGSNTGGGWMGALGGALGGAQWAQNMWGTK